MKRINFVPSNEIHDSSSLSNSVYRRKEERGREKKDGGKKGRGLGRETKEQG